MNQFARNPETNCVNSCRAGHAPIESIYKESSDVFLAKFEKEFCDNCPLRNQCPIQEQKKYNNIRFTGNKLHTDTVRSSMGTERHKELSNFRAGIEGLPSALRRAFNVDHIPVRGYVCSKVWINIKIMVLNFKMFWKLGLKAE